MAIDIIARGMIESSKNDISQLFDITKGGEIVNNESSYSIDNAADYPLLGLNLYGKSTQDGTPTPTNPVDIVSVGDNGAVDITACGKNLYEGSQDWSGTWVNDSQWETAKEKYLGLIVKKKNTAWSGIGKIIRVQAGKTYVFSCFAKADEDISAALYVGVSGYATAQIDNPFITFGITAEWKRYEISFTCTQLGTIFPRLEKRTSNDGTLYICGYQLEVSDTATDYDPYKANTATISTALPLCGVGDVCDEIIYNADGTGKIVKRIGKYTFTGNESFALRGNRDNMYMYSVTNLLQFKRGAHANVLCDKYNSIGNVSNIQAAIATLQSGEVCVWNQTDNCTIYFGSNCSDLESFKAEVTGATVMYQLAESQEIELSAAEISALREMRTYSGITNISNDGGADMDVKYCTNKALSEFVYPITTGLQKQIDELKVAVLSLGGNV